MKNIFIIVAFVMQGLFTACIGLGLSYEFHKDKRHKTALLILAILAAILIADMEIFIKLLGVNV